MILALFSVDDGSEAGRRGNALYEQGAYAEAEAAYRDGLAALDDTTAAVYASLHNNLGAALFQQEKYDEARQAFSRAAAAAVDDGLRQNALYNAGNSAAAGGDLEPALTFYRRVLLLNPAYEDARFNYEYLKREMAKRQPSQRQPPEEQIEPSDYARRLKRRAELMVAQRQYDAARALMSEGIQQDSTVAAYRDFITRLDDVAQIDRMNQR